MPENHALALHLTTKAGLLMSEVIYSLIFYVSVIWWKQDEMHQDLCDAAQQVIEWSII